MTQQLLEEIVAWIPHDQPPISASSFIRATQDITHQTKNGVKNSDLSAPVQR